MRALGIDPGLATTGYGLVRKEGPECHGEDYGHISTPAGLALQQRLLLIFNGVQALIDKFSPEAIALEKLFFSKNTRTALQVGEARGAILTAVAEKGLPVYEYTPLQVKQAVAGYGRADKKQVQQMVSALLRLPALPQPDDAADALAVALCFLQSFKLERLSR
jgi:crossover junction endodeoxyribonuclease RuvC